LAISSASNVSSIFVSILVAYRRSESQQAATEGAFAPIHPPSAGSGGFDILEPLSAIALDQLLFTQ
jgi:hypothetical protein